MVSCCQSMLPYVETKAWPPLLIGCPGVNQHSMFHQLREPVKEADKKGKHQIRWKQKNHWKSIKFLDQMNSTQLYEKCGKKMQTFTIVGHNANVYIDIFLATIY